MSERPDRRRWFRFGPRSATAAIVTLSIFSAHAFAADPTVALPHSVTGPITKVLPDTWTYETKGSRLVLQPRKQPTFVNFVNTDRRRPNETLDEYNRRHTVKFDYRIVLRFEPKLSFEEYCELIRVNRGVLYSFKVLEKSPLALPIKGDTAFPETPEGASLSKQLDQLLTSFRSVPAGYIGSMSVFVEPTVVGYASFLREEDKLEAEAVEKRIIEQLTPYTDEPDHAPRRKRE